MDASVHGHRLLLCLV